jgi:DnaK suppressor protein
MSKSNAHVRRQLEAERDRVLAELAEEIEGPSQMTYGSQAAAAAEVFEQQKSLALRDQAQHHLALVQAALDRIDAGTYGTCQRCGSPIGAERLEALPWAAYCIDCQRLVDREHR